MRTGLVTGGATMFGVPYLISILVAAGGANSGCCNAMWAPVVGPLIQMGAWGPGTDKSAMEVGDIFLVLDAVLQGAGVGMFIAGIAWPKTVLLRNDLGKAHVMPMPMVGQNMAGMGVVGSF
jgi:hypothetical protein